MSALRVGSYFLLWWSILLRMKWCYAEASKRNSEISEVLNFSEHSILFLAILCFKHYTSNDHYLKVLKIIIFKIHVLIVLRVRTIYTFWFNFFFNGFIYTAVRQLVNFNFSHLRIYYYYYLMYFASTTYAGSWFHVGAVR